MEDTFRRPMLHESPLNSDNIHKCKRDSSVSQEFRLSSDGRDDCSSAQLNHTMRAARETRWKDSEARTTQITPTVVLRGRSKRRAFFLQNGKNCQSYRSMPHLPYLRLTLSNVPSTTSDERPLVSLSLLCTLPSQANLLLDAIFVLKPL